MRQADTQSIDGILASRIQKVRGRREWRRLLADCAVIVLAVWIVFNYVIGFATVNGDALEPYIYDDEIVMFYRLESSYMSGDVVVLSGDAADNVRLIAADTTAAEEDLGVSLFSENGVLSAEEAREMPIAGRVVLHVGFTQ